MSTATAVTAPFQVGHLYSSTEIHAALGVGNAGGVRVALADDGKVKRLVIMTAISSAKHARENPYHDRIEGEVLVYTGAGLEGDQTLAGVNKRIPQQVSELFPIYIFDQIASRRNKSHGPRRWKFLGVAQYLRHYPETQVDTHGQLRQAWVFEFRIFQEPVIVEVGTDALIAREVIQNNPLSADASQDDRLTVTDLGESSGQVDMAAYERIRSRLLNLDPRGFEVFIKDLLARSGFERVAVTKYSQDGGIDVEASASFAMWPLKDLRLQVQAKRWLHTVGRKEVAELRGSLAQYARGSVVTTSYFSKAALNEAKEEGKNPIVLVDGHSLARIVHSTGIQLS